MKKKYYFNIFKSGKDTFIGECNLPLRFVTGYMGDTIDQVADFIYNEIKTDDLKTLVIKSDPVFTCPYTKKEKKVNTDELEALVKKLSSNTLNTKFIIK